MNIFTGIQSPKVIYETDSKYNGHIKVVQFGSTLKIKVDNIDQSLNPDSPACARLYWGKVMEVLKENKPDMKSMLILGLGGGTIPHLVSRSFPETKMIAVELDQVMADIAYQYFDVGKIPNLTVIVEDAMRVVVEPEKYGIQEHSLDAVLVDIYVGQKYPDLGRSGNFVAAIKRLMHPNGLVIFNRIYVDEHQDDVNIFIDYLENQLANVKCTVVAGYTNSDNILIYGRPQQSMTLFQAFILGVVQGATEFLPVSSSGHLILVPKFLGMQEQPLVFDTTMHLATALTLVVFFFKDYVKLIKKFFTDLITHRSLFPKDRGEPGLMLLIIASIPAALLGFMLDDTIENIFRNAWHVALFMTIGTLLMLGAEHFGKKVKSTATVKEGFIIGIFQSLALFPGVSRSGATISGGMFMGMTRDYAARFSFLISVPIVVAASVFKIISTDWAISTVTFAELAVGFISSFITGMLAVKFLLNYLKTKGLSVFIIYRVLLLLFVLLALV